MKKTMIMLMMVMMAVMNVNAQWVVADDYNYLYVGVPGATVQVPRSAVPYGKDLTKGDFVPTTVTRLFQRQASDEFNATGSVIRTGEVLAEPIMLGVGIFGQISATVKAAKAAKRARKAEAERARAAQTAAPRTTTTRTYSSAAPIETATPRVNKNVTYNVSKQRFETAEDLISGF